MKVIGIKKPLDKEFLSHIEDLVDSDAVNEMKKVIHHGKTTTFEHCLNVSYYNYLICKKLGLDARAAARGGLLHDLFLYDWHTVTLADGHALQHAKRARANAEKYFDITPLERDIIEKHMFPLTFALPKHRESFVTTLTDKYCGALEVITHRWGKIRGKKG
ncbi:MAG: HDIG domain-containing protein [Ruminococcus sp.]|jgi:uncharacterized protein|nr:HDIG domain-containing protein [Ruminococcus sp.]